VQERAEIGCRIDAFEAQIDHDVVGVVAGLKHFCLLDTGLLARRRKPVEKPRSTSSGH
jgi:hypothetical protein